MTTSRVFSLFAALAALTPQAGAAQEPGPGSELEPAPIAVVMVASRSEEARSLQVIHALEAQLSDLPVVFHVTWVSEHDAALPGQRDVAAREAARLGATAVFWSPRLPAERLYLLLSSGAGQRVLVRALEGESANTEAVALIVRGAVSAVLEASRSRADAASAFAASSAWAAAPATAAGPATRPAAAPPTAELAPPPEEAQAAPPDRVPRRRSRLTLAAGYALSLWSRDDPAIHGFSVALEGRLPFGLTLDLGLVLGEPVGGEAEGVELELLRFPIELGVGYRHLFRRAALSGTVAVGLTPFVKRVSAAEGMEVVSRGADLDVSLRPSVAVDVRLVAQLNARVAFGLEIPLTPVSYLVEVGSQTSDVLVTWPVRPFFVVGLSLGVL
jgi:hypothetical protein